MVPLVFISIFLLSAVLLVFGLRGRRIGDEPRCRKCKYNLTGAISANCPECGTAISSATIRRGSRKVRPIISSFAVLLIGTQVGLLHATYRNKINWHNYYPYSILVRSAQRGDK